MYIEKIYSKEKQLAFVVLGHCRTADDVILEMELFTLQTGITLPPRINTEIVSKLQWQGMVLLKFELPEKALSKDKTGPWLMLDNNPELLEKIMIVKFRKEENTAA